MIKLSASVKVGILTLVSLCVLIFSLMWLKGRSISTGSRTEVQFQDVDGMRPGSAVQIMGIRVGQVEDVIPVLTKDKSYVSVKFVLTEPNIYIPTASTISIQQSGIIGEKFLEITPPQVQSAFLPIYKGEKTLLFKNSKVDLLVNQHYIDVGIVKNTEIIANQFLPQSEQDNIKTKFAYKVDYIVTKPGIIVPEGATPLITQGNEHKLNLTPPVDVLVSYPTTRDIYTVVEPVRLKKFFEIQLKSAIALKETNDKINSILSEETISDLKSTLKNTKELTASATVTINEANKLILSTKSEINSIVDKAGNLSDKVALLADNVNGIVADPQLKNDLTSTTNSIKITAKSLSELISDTKLKETLSSMNSTSKDLSEITKNVNDYTKDKEFKVKLDQTVGNLNASLGKLTNVLNNVDGLTKNQQENVESILNDSTEISKNLKQFSTKLNKRFVLFRLMF